MVETNLARDLGPKMMASLATDNHAPIKIETSLIELCQIHEFSWVLGWLTVQF